MPTRPAILALAIALGAVRDGLADGDYLFAHDDVMGTSMEFSVRAVDLGAARRAEARALREIDRLSAIFSNHDPSSEFRRWQAGPAGPSRVSPELIEVLGRSDAWRERSGGAFDPRVQALSSLWSEAARRGRHPTGPELDRARASASGPAWRLDAGAGTAERLPGPPLTLDAIAKGYIVERASDAALAGDPAVLGLVLNVGGDLRVVGEPSRLVDVAGPDSTGPVARVEVKDLAVATSGRKHRGYQVGPRWYSHIIDPRTGEPAELVASSTVIAPRSVDADAMATALNVLSPAEGLRMVDAHPGAACLVVLGDGRVLRSAAWARFERAGPPGAGAVDGPGPARAGGGWGDDRELLVRFTINRPRENGRYRRPYVAVWAEDEAGAPVRNLLLWVSMGGAGPFEWLPDLKRWYADDRARTKANKTDVFQIAQPTRPPGEYSVLWDGKDDQGRPMKPGAYTVLIEAVREQGGYGLIRQRVSLDSEGFVKELKGNDEIQSATLEYRPRGAGR